MYAVGSVRASRLGVVAGLVPVAAVVALDPAGWYPFGVAKHGAVFVAALAAIACAAGLPGRLPRPVAWLWAALLGWLAVAAAFGADPLYAWIGTPERRLGWLTWALLGGCAWAGARIGGHVQWLSRMAVIAGLWCGGYTLVELWWRAPVETTSATSRLGGPFGSAAYLGAALCLLLPLSAGVAVDRGERMAWRVAAGAAAVAGSVALVGSGTRAAWIGLGLAGGWAVVRHRPSWRMVALAGGVLVVAVLAVAPRLDDVAERDGAGGSSRVAEWEVATRVIGHHPVLGAGPEGYRVVFADGVDAEYEREYGRTVLPDRAHSGPLDLAAIGGVPAALVYVALLAFVAWRAAQRADPFGIAILAYLAQQSVLFPLAELDPIFWLIAGAVVAVPAPARGGAPVVRGVSVGAAAAVFAVSVVGVAADRLARDTLRGGGLAAAERAAELRPDVIRYHLLVAREQSARQSVEGAREAVAATDRAADVSPGDPIVRQAGAEARLRLAQVTGRPGDVRAAIDAYDDLLADDPHCTPCRAGLAAAQLLEVRP